MSPSEQERVVTKAREICSRYTEGITVAAPIELRDGVGVCLRVPSKKAWASASLRKMIQQIEQIPGVERVFAEMSMGSP
jgi:hypothetical protein